MSPNSPARVGDQVGCEMTYGLKSHVGACSEQKIFRTNLCLCCDISNDGALSEAAPSCNCDPRLLHPPHRPIPSPNTLRSPLHPISLFHPQPCLNTYPNRSRGSTSILSRMYHALSRALLRSRPSEGLAPSERGYLEAGRRCGRARWGEC